MKADALLPQRLFIKLRRKWLSTVPGNQRVNATASAILGDAQQATDGDVGKTAGKIGDRQNLIRFGHLAGLLVVLKE